MQDLLSLNDPDWEAFNNASPEYMLRVGGEVIRRYCGWHIFPVITETVSGIPVGSKGIIPMPTTHLTDVSAVSVTIGNGDTTVLQTSEYSWRQEGIVRIAYGATWHGDYLPYAPGALATITFTHGYTAVPDPVKQVAYELTATAIEQPAGNVRSLSSPGFSMTLSDSTGMVLTHDHKNRLSHYRLPTVR